jgi:tetratricopeptide (TPR) repeat protein
MIVPRDTTRRLGSAFGAVLALALTAACAAPSATERARSLVRQNRDEDALAVLRERLRHHPEDVDARRLLVRVLASSGAMVEARAEVNALASLLPAGDPTADIELGHALELAHRYDEALEAYDHAATVAPASPEGPREGGMRAAHWGETGAALRRLEEAVRRGARDADTWHALGLVRLHGGDADGAALAYRAGVAANPGGPGAAENWLGLASVAVAQSDAAAALSAYDQVLSRRPRFAPAELGRAWALARLGRREEASRALDHAAELGAPAANIARQRAALTER